MGDDCGETFVDEPDWRRRNDVRERFGKVSCLVSGLSSPSGKASRKPDDNLDHMPLGRQRCNLGKIAAATAHRRKRAGKQPIRVAARDPDPSRSDVNAKPDAGPQCVWLQVPGVRSGTTRLQHDLTLRYLTHRCRQYYPEPH